MPGHYGGGMKPKKKKMTMKERLAMLKKKK